MLSIELLLFAVGHQNHVDGQTSCSGVCVCASVMYDAGRACEVEMTVFCSCLLYYRLSVITHNVIVLHFDPVSY